MLRVEVEKKRREKKKKSASIRSKSSHHHPSLSVGSANRRRSGPLVHRGDGRITDDGLGRRRRGSGASSLGEEGRERPLSPGEWCGHFFFFLLFFLSNVRSNALCDFSKISSTPNTRKSSRLFFPLFLFFSFVKTKEQDKNVAVGDRLCRRRRRLFRAQSPGLEASSGEFSVVDVLFIWKKKREKENKK